MARPGPTTRGPLPLKPVVADRDQEDQTGQDLLHKGQDADLRQTGLHDQTVADLSRISRNIRRLAGWGGAVDSELATLEEDVNHCLRELRVMVDDARLSVLDLFSFALQPKTPVRGQVKDESGGVIDLMPGHSRVALYRIVQEAVYNAVRHSGARLIAERIAASGPRTTIRAQGDTRSPPSEKRRHASDIANMRTRAALVDVGFRLKSGAGGTEVRLDIDSRALLPQRDGDPA